MTKQFLQKSCKLTSIDISEEFILAWDLPYAKVYFFEARLKFNKLIHNPVVERGHLFGFGKAGKDRHKRFFSVISLTWTNNHLMLCALDILFNMPQVSQPNLMHMVSSPFRLSSDIFGISFCKVPWTPGAKEMMLLGTQRWGTGRTIACHTKRSP